MPITHRQIDVFRAVMQAGSLKQAASALHSSQPTLSRELALAEQRLGYALFERQSGSRLRPTAAAQQLFAAVQQHYLGLAQVQAQAQRLARQDAQQLQLLALPAMAHGLLPQALQAWGQLQRRVAITPAESPLLEAWMGEQRFDLGLAERQQAVSGCSVEALPALPQLAVLPAGHRLAQKLRLEPEDFAAEPFISLADDDPYRAPIDALFAEAGVQRSLRLQTHSAVAACALVAQGLGLAIVNPFTAMACEGPSLIWRSLSRVLPFQVSLLRPLHRPLPAGLDELQQALRDSVQQALARLAHHSAGRSALAP